MEQAQQQMQVPFFRLYGLLGCPHCVSAQKYLADRHVPFLVNVGNDDPIIQRGVKEITGNELFPVLVVTFTKPVEIITGFKQEDYERLVKLYHVLAGSGAFAVPDSGQQPQPQAPSQVTSTAAPSGAS